MVLIKYVRMIVEGVSLEALYSRLSEISATEMEPATRRRYLTWLLVEYILTFPPFKDFKASLAHWFSLNTRFTLRLSTREGELTDFLRVPAAPVQDKITRDRYEYVREAGLRKMGVHFTPKAKLYLKNAYEKLLRLIPYDVQGVVMSFWKRKMNVQWALVEVLLTCVSNDVRADDLLVGGHLDGIWHQISEYTVREVAEQIDVAPAVADRDTLRLLNQRDVERYKIDLLNLNATLRVDLNRSASFVVLSDAEYERRMRYAHENYNRNIYSEAPRNQEEDETSPPLSHYEDEEIKKKAGDTKVVLMLCSPYCVSLTALAYAGYVMLNK